MGDGPVHPRVSRFIALMGGEVPDLTDEEWSSEHDRRREISEQSTADWEAIGILAELIHQQRQR